MTFQPYPTRSGFILLTAAIFSLAATILLIDSLLQQNEPTQVFKYAVWLLIALSIFCLTLYWTLIAVKLNYHISRNGVAIQWGLEQQRIPFNAI